MRNTKRTVGLIGITAVVAGILTAPSASASAVAEAGRPGAIASFEGRSIDLALDGWQGAQTCVVDAPERIRCYGEAAEADAALGYTRTADPLVRRAAFSAAAVPACASGWLCLYEHTNGGGRRLIFNDEYWHNLYDYGFQNQTSSWRNTQSSGDSGGLRMSDNQAQLWIGAPGYVSNIGIYNDRAYMVHG
ncbi:peptidase inhibitor family I36 protein [Streptomyces sp. NPDC047886]|uniref:peptidase inhibitor family I36 protein n=1 Tax=Streptomyces sp. NPDC047886 TaxID=3365490 RepID=UPI0037155060